MKTYVFTRGQLNYNNNNNNNNNKFICQIRQLNTIQLVKRKKKPKLQ